MRLDYRGKQRKLLVAEERAVIENSKIALAKLGASANNSNEALSSSLVLSFLASESRMYNKLPLIKFSSINCLQFMVYSGLCYVRNERENMKGIEDFMKGYEYVVKKLAHASLFPMSLFKEVANMLSSNELEYFLENPCGPLTNILFLILLNKKKASKEAYNMLNEAVNKNRKKAIDEFVLVSKGDVLDTSKAEEIKESKFKQSKSEIIYLESVPYINNSVYLLPLIVEHPKESIYVLLQKLVNLIKSLKVKDKSIFARVRKSSLFPKIEAKAAILRVAFTFTSRKKAY